MVQGAPHGLWSGHACRPVPAPGMAVATVVLSLAVAHHWRKGSRREEDVEGGKRMCGRKGEGNVCGGKGEGERCVCGGGER